jgi:hypothetical protein
MIMPGVRQRRAVDRRLRVFFRQHGVRNFQSALAALSRFYRLRTPRIRWFEYLDWGKTGGRTYENGVIHLVHPENWKRGRKYNSERQWMHTVYHEMGHYVLWADAERKADQFAYRFLRGVGIQAASRHRPYGTGQASRARRKHRRGRR